MSKYPQRITLFADQMIHFQNFIEDDLHHGDFSDVGVSIYLEDYDDQPTEKRFALFIEKEQIQDVINILEKMK